MKYVQAYGIALVIFLIMDALWLGVVARNFYMSRIGDLILDQPRWGVAALFYLVYIAGLVFFAISVGLAQNSWQLAAGYGAMFGLLTYMTYNFTNLAVMRGFDTTVAFVDTGWGTFVGASMAGGTVFIMQRLGWVSG